MALTQISTNGALTARLYLEGVLPTLVPLVQHDPAAKALIAGSSPKRFGIRFSFPGHPGSGVYFRDGEAVHLLGNGQAPRPEVDVPTLSLWLASATQCARLFAQSGFALPLPVGGWTALRHLGTFQKLTERLQDILQPSAASLDDPALRRLHVYASLHVAVRALVPMLELDPVGREVRPRLPRGIAVFRYRDDQFAPLWLDSRGAQPSAGVGPLPGPALVTLEFRHDESARLAMAGKLDSLAALGLGDLVLSGLVPFADSLDLVMQRIGAYVSPAQ